jgi:hypothetical protein
MDFQDPWVTDYYRARPEVVPPGGRIKWWIGEQINRVLESWVVRQCGGFLSVSPAYVEDIRRRYGPLVARAPFLTAPFPAEPQESDCMPGKPPATIRREHVWRYVGAAGPFMQKSIKAFFQAWGHARSLDRAYENLKFEAIGTSYAAKDVAGLAFVPYAREFGLTDCVSESAGRVPYSTAVQLLRNSDALVVFGSDDSGYAASKIFPYLLSRRPLLGIFHEKSPVVALMHEVGGGVCVTFNEETTLDLLAGKIFRVWFSEGRYREVMEMDCSKFAPYTASEQARAIGSWFRSILAAQAARRV